MTHVTPVQRKLLAEAASRELARQSLLDFAARMNPKYLTPPHIKLIAEHLERLERREIRRLRISCPPRAGKTLLAVKLFTAWYIGRHPDHEVACCSYNEDTAVLSTRAIRDYIGDERYPFETRIRSDSSAAYRMNTEQGGAIVAAGVTSGLTGRGAHLLAIDDSVKNFAEAHSPTVSDSVIAWWQTVAATRLYPDSIVLCIGTRWSGRDLQSHLIDNDDGEWTHLSLPAICEGSDDPLGREVGDVLWPDVFTPAFVAKQRATLGEQNFMALYQGNPIAAEGGIFKGAWFAQRYTERDLPHPQAAAVPWSSGIWSPPTVVAPLLKVMAVDGSWAKSLHSDYSAFVVVGTDGSKIYILDVYRERLQLPELTAALVRLNRKHSPSAIVIEAAASGDALVQSLRSTLLPIFASRPQGGSKESRWQAIAPLCENGRVLLPAEAPWLTAFTRELFAVPAGKYDDQVDALALAVSSCVRYFHEQTVQSDLESMIDSIGSPLAT